MRSTPHHRQHQWGTRGRRAMRLLVVLSMVIAAPLGTPAAFGDGPTQSPPPPLSHAVPHRTVTTTPKTPSRHAVKVLETPSGVGMGSLHAVTPCRLLDTRSGLGVPNAQPVGPEGSVTVPVSGACGVPETGALAVAVNITATGATAETWVTVWPASSARPNTSNLNVPKGVDLANLVQVKLDPAGRISLSNHAGQVGLLADVLGWYSSDDEPDAGRLTSLNPSRILDTRAGNGAPIAKIPAKGTVDLQVAGRGGVPAAGASAVVLNLTSTRSTSPTFVTAWPSGVLRPTSSNLNVVRGKDVANRVVVKLGDDGKVSLFNSSGSTDLIVDVSGWYSDSTAVSGGGSGFRPIDPIRLADTRTGLRVPKAKLGAGQSLTIAIAGKVGVPSAADQVPATAVVVNLTATNPTSGTFLTAFPSDYAQPLASDVNVAAGRTVPNLAVVKLSHDGSITIFNSSGTVDVIVDVMGWFAGGVVFNAPVVALSTSEAAAVESVTTDTIVLASTPGRLAALQPGDVVASGSTATAPDGYLRRVISTSTTNGTTTVATEQISLDEAVAEGSFDGTIPLVSGTPANTTDHLSPHASVSQSITVPFGAGLTGTTENNSSAEAKLTGSVKYTAAMELHAKIGFFSGITAHFESQLATDFTATVSTSVALKLASTEKELADVPFGRYTFFIGGLPVVIEPGLSLDLVAEGSLGASVSAQVTKHSSVTAGFDMHNSDVTPYHFNDDSPLQSSVTAPAVEAKVKVELQEKLYARFYHGLELSVGFAEALSASVTTETCSLQFAFDIDALAKFDVKIFGHQVGDGYEGRVSIFSGKIGQPIKLADCGSDHWEVAPAVTATDLAADLAGPGLTVTGATYTGNPGAEGTFKAPVNSVFLEAGTVLSSGLAADAPGPNNKSGNTTSLGEPGDDALSAISGGETQDAASLTLDFIPTSTHLSVNFVFGSEEYDEYVGSQYNDVAGIFVNGVNCAVINKGFDTVPTTVNAINANVNTLQYVENSAGDRDAQADGTTTLLQCKADVVAGQTNSIKIAIADTGDSALDSWLFVQHHSLTAN